MNERRGAKKISAEQAGPTLSADDYGFASTAELEPLDAIVGQPRALKSLELGLAIRHPSYNIFVAGASGMGKKRLLEQALEARVGESPTPPDWVYVNNFDEPDRPLALSLPAGAARRLDHDMKTLVERLSDELPKAQQHDDLTQKKQVLQRRLQKQVQERTEHFEREARERGLGVEHMKDGVALVPLKEDGEPMSSEEVEALGEDARAAMEDKHQELAEELTRLMSKQRELERELHEEAKALDREFAASVIGPLVDDLRSRYDDERLLTWLEQMKGHMIDHWDRFRPDAEQNGKAAQMLGLQVPEGARFRDYRVNVLVDNGDQRGAPVVVEDAPNYKNLFGILDRATDRRGAESTDFTHIKSGSLLRACGGYLIFNLRDALMEPVVWKELKRTIKRRSLQIEAYEPFGMFSTAALKPEPIPLDVKLVAVGEPNMFHMLHLLDEDFRDIFKVKAEFDPQMNRDEHAGRTFGRLIARLCEQEEDFLPFTATGVAELVRAGARIAGSRDKLTTELTRIADLARESVYWARRDGAERVERRHVREASEERLFRSNLVASKILELIEDGVLRIDVGGKTVGQVHGLVYADLGDYAFGRPSRITASVGVGTAGVVNIERESKLSGGAYDKAMLILQGYLRNRYAGEHPIALSASIALEQSYGPVDGDSASVAEIACLTSALANVPLRQDIAVTGSVNQWGDVQAVGGVNEKIEGFFDVCRMVGLTGEQGVIIPAANAKHLVLRPDVVQAMQERRFSVWTADHVDDALELLTDRAPGDVDGPETLHGRVDQRLRALADALKASGMPHEGGPSGPSPATSRPADPRPPLPGRDN